MAEIELWAASGSVADIMSTIQQAHNIGANYTKVTVRIPNSLSQPDGKWHWNIGGTFSQSVNAAPYGDEFPCELEILGEGIAGCSGEPDFVDYQASTIIHNDAPIVAGSPANIMFALGGMTHGLYRRKRISLGNLQLEASKPATANAENLGGSGAAYFEQIPDFRGHHLTLVDFASVPFGASCNDGHEGVDVSCYGLIDHCRFTNPYKLNAPPDVDWYWAYGAYPSGNLAHDTWINDGSVFRGKYGWVKAATIMYVEDCHFSYNRHAIDGVGGGYTVARHNLLDFPACGYTAASLNNHGSAFPSCYGSEFYNNKVIGAPGNKKPWSPYSSYYSVAVGLRGGKSLVFNNEFICDTYSPYNYFLQIQGGDDVAGLEEQWVHESYIWDNVYSNCSFSSIGPHAVQNVDYFLRAPTEFTYTPYPYPHPRATGQPLPVTHGLTVNSNLNNIPFIVRRVA